MMKTVLSLLFICLVALASCGVTGSEKDDKGHPNIPGKIVFSAKDKAGVPQIYTIKANGTHLKQITHFSKHSNRSGIEPAWSPDGSRIAFASYSGSTLGTYLMVMDADGSNMRLLKHYKKGPPKGMIGAWPSWSPDGTKIAFQVCTNCEIGGSNYEISYVTVKGRNYAPGQLHAVTNSPTSDRRPIWSPDGSRIAFVSNRAYVHADTLRLRRDLYLVDTDGLNLKGLTKNQVVVGNVAWASNSRSIVFASKGKLYKYKFRADTVLTLLSDFSFTNVRALRWSKGDKYLLFTVINYPKSSFYLYNNHEKTIKKLPIKTRRILGADWFIKK